MTEDDKLMESALRRARDTRKLVVDVGARRKVGEVFAELFGDSPCIIIADENTFAVAGKDVHDSLRAGGSECLPPLVLEAEGLYAEYSFVTRIQEALARQQCDSHRRRRRLDQRSHEAGVPPERPAVSLRGDGRVDGRLHGVRRIDHARRLEANVRLPRAARRRRRSGSHRRRAGRTECLRLCRPRGEVPGRGRLDSGRLPGRRSDRPRELGDGADAARRVDGRPGRHPQRRFRSDSPAHDRR